MSGSSQSRQSAEADVAIIGCGPTGALLANLLGAYGVRVIVLERDRGIHPLPRAVHFDGEVMRIFQAAGLADEMAHVARSTSQGMHFVNGEGRTLLVRRGVEGRGPQGWANNWYFHQPSLERVLRAGMERYRNVEVRLGCVAARVIDGADAAVIETADGEMIRARYVVGCDGARSLVRQTIGSQSEDLGLHQPWLVVDAIMNPQSARAAALPGYTVQHCDPARPMTAVCVSAERRRWEIMLMPGDDPATMETPERMWSLLSRWIGPEDATLERSAIYTFHSVVARGWRKGRLLLAGDACHQTPPFLGQGMCAGLRDAANLAWKLAMVVEGRADATLLDTYESERRPHVATFIQLAVDIGAIIQATDPAVAAKRDKEMLSGEPRFFDYPQPQLGPGVHDGAGVPSGVVFPQPDLGDGRLLDEAAGNGFALIVRDRGIIPADGLAALGVAVIEASGGELPRWLERYGAEAVIVRPDRYVLGIARGPGDLDRLIGLLPHAQTIAQAGCPGSQ